MWLSVDSPRIAADVVQPILALADAEAARSGLAGSGCREHQFDLLVAQQGDGLRIELASALKGRRSGWSCLQLQADAAADGGQVFADGGGMHHLAIVVKSGAPLRVYVDGEQLELYLAPTFTIDASAVAVAPQYSSWRSSHRVLVAPRMESALEREYGWGRAGPPRAWGGALHSLAFYAAALNASQIARNLAASVRDSAPIAHEAVVYLAEDTTVAVGLSGGDPFDETHGQLAPVRAERWRVAEAAGRTGGRREKGGRGEGERRERGEGRRSEKGDGRRDA